MIQVFLLLCFSLGNSPESARSPWSDSYWAYRCSFSHSWSRLGWCIGSKAGISRNGGSGGCKEGSRCHPGNDQGEIRDLILLPCQWLKCNSRGFQVHITSLSRPPKILMQVLNAHFARRSSRYIGIIYMLKGFYLVQKWITCISVQIIMNIDFNIKFQG